MQDLPKHHTAWYHVIPYYTDHENPHQPTLVRLRINKYVAATRTWENALQPQHTGIMASKVQMGDGQQTQTPPAQLLRGFCQNNLELVEGTVQASRVTYFTLAFSQFGQCHC